VSPKEHSYSKSKDSDHLTKKCPECYAYLPLHAKVCTACQAKVGEVDKIGFAEKPVNWWGYLIAAASVIGFAIYMWWAFFREGA
jgi:hypothetical protein